MAALLLPLVAQSQELPREVRLEALQAVVQVTAFDDDRDIWTELSGSGSIISDSGLVLTNYHVMGSPEERSNYPRAGIFQTDRSAPFEQPQLRWWAEFVAGDPALDLALLRITENADGTAFDPAAGLVALKVADSNQLLPGDALTVVGYPGISGSTITFTQGVVSGWLGEDTESGGQRWIKTDAKITRGNSGGAALNARGELVAVPTSGNHLMDEGDIYEEQLYARPVALAWPMFAALADEIEWAEGQRPGPAMLAAAGEPWTPVAGPGVGAGAMGSLDLDIAASSTIAGSPDGDVVWHTYTLRVDDYPVTVRVQASSRDDIDLAVGLRGEIPGFTGGDADFMDFSVSANPELVFDLLEPTLVHIDVVNSWGYPIEYGLTATAGPLAVDAGGYPEPRATGHRGRLEAGRTIRSNLALHATQGLTGWHTYVFVMPERVTSATFMLEPESVLGLAVKPGSDIVGYLPQSEGGDAAASQDGGQPGAPIRLQVAAPQAGLWFIDVYNLAGRAMDGRYALQVELKTVSRSR